jgi:hypothetical protein
MSRALHPRRMPVGINPRTIGLGGESPAGVLANAARMPMTRKRMDVRSGSGSNQTHQQAPRRWNHRERIQFCFGSRARVPEHRLLISPTWDADGGLASVLVCDHRDYKAAAPLGPCRARLLLRFGETTGTCIRFALLGTGHGSQRDHRRERQHSQRDKASSSLRG